MHQKTAYVGGSVEQYRRICDEAHAVRLALSPGIKVIAERELLPRIRREVPDLDIMYEVVFDPNSSRVDVVLKASNGGRPVSVDDLAMLNNSLAGVYNQVSREYGLPIRGFVAEEKKPRKIDRVLSALRGSLSSV